MKKIISLGIIVAVAFSSCSKSSTTTTPTTPITPAESFAQLETDVTNDFVNKTALPQYDSLASAAVLLNTAILNLQSNTTDANLQIAQASWKHIRTVWEQCEGFLITVSPIEANDYDPNTDTWPTDHIQMDSLLNNLSNPLQVADIGSLALNLRGYHPIEYLLFRNGEYTARTAASFTPRQLQYLTSLSADILYNNVQPLLNSWTEGTGNASYPLGFAQAITGDSLSSNVLYPTKQAAFLDIVGAMADICNEVGEPDGDGKMYAPYVGKNNQGDSTITESPYSDNSLIDFRNNIVGAQNVYLGLNGGKGIKDLVAAKNQSLDNQIQQQFTATIGSFDKITQRFELAIQVNGGQRLLVAQTLAQVQALQSLLDTQLTDFVKQYVTN